MSKLLTEDELRTCTVSNLRAQLKKKKLGTNGKKDVLVRADVAWSFIWHFYFICFICFLLNAFIFLELLLDLYFA
jgi:hypothetical protein